MGQTSWMVKKTTLHETPEKEKIATAIGPTEVSGNTSSPKLTAEEAALQEMGEEQLELPTPADFGDKHIPDLGDVVVPFDKINEIYRKRHLGTEADHQKQIKPLRRQRRNNRKSFRLLTVPSLFCTIQPCGIWMI